MECKVIIKNEKILRFFFLLHANFASVMPKCTDNLNKAQHDAVVNYQSPSLIVAGAGSGKTRVLTCRIAYMLEQGVTPSSILALTFTNKAAREMRERISAMVGEGQARRLWMGTFHSIFARILRAEAAVMGFPQSFTIYDSADSKNLVRRIIKDMNLSDDSYKPGDILSRISLAKNNLITAAAYEANTNLVAEDRQHKRPETVNIYKEYTRRCREYGAMDFDDLLLNINILFRDHPEVTARYQQAFQYILVDEYQDTNYAQYIIIRRLAQQHSRVCVVGDDAQSIYSFRGAKIENILRFRNDFPQARTFKLEQNYRSTKTIVNAANSLIAKNENQIKKESFSEGPTGPKIKVVRAYTDQEEASMVADELRGMVREGSGEWSDAAILYRTNAQSRVLEEALRRRGMPYRIYGGTSFYQRKEVKDMVAYIRLVVNPRDEESLRRVINFPARGIGDVTVERVVSAAQNAGVTMMEAIHSMEAEALGLNAGAAKKVKEFAAMIDAISLLRAQMGLYQIGMEIATRSGLIGMYKANPAPEAMSALENIEELLNSMQLFTDELAAAASQDDAPAEPTLEEWLQNIALLTDADNEEQSEKDRITLMTVHAAKGLEFRYVAVAGMEENLFPNQMGLGTQEGLEEERRLLYVAVTRARDAAVLAFAQQRFKWGQMTFSRPSRFLSEIDPKYLDMDFPLDESAPEAPADPVTELRRRFDYRQKEVRREGGFQTGNAYRGAGAPPPKPQARVEPVRTSTDGMRSLGVRQRDESPAATPSAPGEIKEGARVRHSKFGAGTVTAAEHMSADLKLTIRFDDGVSRTLLQKFARLELL